ncbi:MAG: TonB-dependent receptor, partial [Bacteroidota bacterium]
FSGQYFNADRNLQPSMNVNTQGDTQSDENLRMMVAFSQKLNKHEWEVKYAYLHDVIGFNDDQTNSDQHVVRGKYNQQLSKAIRLNLGADYNFIKVQAPFYIEDNIEETRTNLWSSIMVNPVPRLILSVNLRQAFNPDYKIPFTSSFGSEYLAINSPSHQMTIKGSFAEGFRLPTLNERFWQPGGNPDIEPEESYSFEMGLDGTIKHNVEINYDLTAYRMWVDNWILWVPGGVYWSPENIKEVDAYGMEASGDIRHKIRGASIKWMANYALTRSINQTGLDSFDRSVGKQLAYVPVHKASFTALTNIKSWSFVMNASYTGKRYTTADNEEFLPAYTLLNLRIAKSFRWNKYQVNGCLSANNVLNTQYQSIENKAMPGINFSAGITINYHKL